VVHTFRAVLTAVSSEFYLTLRVGLVGVETSEMRPGEPPYVPKRRFRANCVKKSPGEANSIPFMLLLPGAAADGKKLMLGPP
jgi:hypothetical protein